MATSTNPVLYQAGPVSISLCIPSADIDLHNLSDPSNIPIADRDIPINLLIVASKLVIVPVSTPDKPDNTGMSSVFSPASGTDDEDDDDDMESIHSDEAEDGKIAKPLGEAGRPKSGGYNLERELAWPEDSFKQLKVSFIPHLHKLDDTNLSTRNLFSSKPASILISNSATSIKMMSVCTIFV